MNATTHAYDADLKDIDVETLSEDTVINLT